MTSPPNTSPTGGEVRTSPHAPSRAPGRGSSAEALGLPTGIRACLFDLDGVLTQTAALHAKAWKCAFDGFLAARARASGEPFVPFDAVRDYDLYVDGKPREDGVRSFLDSRSLVLPEGPATGDGAAETVSGLGGRKNALFKALLQEEGVTAFPGSIRYVRAVLQAGLRAAVVSSSTNCVHVLDAARIADLFAVRIDGVVAARDHLTGKPAPDTYLAAARALSVPPGQAAVFEDALAGVDAGRAGSFGFVVGVDRSGQAEALRRHGADIVVTDLDTLLSAT